MNQSGFHFMVHVMSEFCLFHVALINFHPSKSLFPPTKTAHVKKKNGRRFPKQSAKFSQQKKTRRFPPKNTPRKRQRLPPAWNQPTTGVLGNHGTRRRRLRRSSAGPPTSKAFDIEVGKIDRCHHGEYTTTRWDHTLGGSSYCWWLKSCTSW